MPPRPWAAPALPAIEIRLETESHGLGVKCGRGQGSDGQEADIDAAAQADGAPAVAGVAALEDGNTASVESGRRRGVDRQGKDTSNSDASVRQAGVDRAPGAAAIEAPKDAAVDTHVEGGRRPRVDRQIVEPSRAGAGGHGTPGRAAVSAPEEAAK